MFRNTHFLHSKPKHLITTHSPNIMAPMKQKSNPSLNVTRAEPDIVCPAQPTPREQKLLSDIDDQEGLRFQMPGLLFYRAFSSMDRKDPVKVIKDALAKTLVFYYPLAGRLVEGPNRKLIVDCNGEGVPFMEADVDARLEDFGDEIQPPFPLNDLLYDIPDSYGMVGTPLLIIQVTRLKCGGFILGLRSNHAVTDALGLMQFMNAVGEIARGATTPTILPVWDRERLSARNPPRITHDHQEYHQDDGDIIIQPQNITAHTSQQVQHSFVFGPIQIAALKLNIDKHVKKYSTFDLLCATLWRCRTKALGLDPNDEVRFVFVVNVRNKFNPSLRDGYYGNACAFATVIAKVGDICDNKVDYILELIRITKGKIDEEYMMSVMDLMVTKDRPRLIMDQTYTYMISDLRHLGFGEVDFGWGKPVFGGPASNEFVPNVSYFMSCKNKEGENVIKALVSLPSTAMDVFVDELRGMLQTQVLL